MTGRDTGFTGAAYAGYAMAGTLPPRLDEIRREYRDNPLTEPVWESIARSSGPQPADRIPYHPL